MPFEDIIGEPIQKIITKEYYAAVADTCKTFSVPTDIVYISAIELSGAIKEANRDLSIMRMRRAPPSSDKFKGLSLGKAAGALCFRLGRYRIVNIGETDSVADHKARRVFYRIQDIVAIKVIASAVLGIPLDPSTQKELLYVMSRRHVNQEMLGIVFERLHRLKR